MSFLCLEINPSELFYQITKSASARAFYNNDLFSYLLRLPVIYSSVETEMICAGFKKDKNTSGVKF